jgi:hypothetical protein
MSRTLLGVLAAVVLVAGIGLYVLLGRSAKTPTTTTTVGSNGTTTVTTTTDPSGSIPSLPSTGSAPALGGPDEYTVGGLKVRDHRRGDNQKLDIPPNVHQPGAVEIPSTLTHELAQQVKAVMRDCVKSLPADARGEAPKLEGQITIAVKDQKASITKSLVLLRDVKESDATTAAKQCIESKSIGIGAPASSVPNLDAYTINVSFLIPKT